MRSREGRLEDYFRKEVESLGGEYFKWPPPPGLDGVPDRIVLFLDRCWLVEMKNSDGKLRPSQRRTLPRISRAFEDTFVLYGHEAVDHFIEEELVSWLKMKLEKTYIVPNALIKGCDLAQIKRNLEELGTDVQSVVTELQQHSTRSPKFFPSSKQAQLKRRKGSS